MLRQMLISEFKAQCIGEIERVQQTGRPLVVTSRGKLIAAGWFCPRRERRSSSS